MRWLHRPGRTRRPCRQRRSSRHPWSIRTSGILIGHRYPVDSAEKINVEVQSVAIPAGGGAPTVTLRLTDDLDFGLKDLPSNAISFTLAQLSRGQTAVPVNGSPI